MKGKGKSKNLYLNIGLAVLALALLGLAGWLAYKEWIKRQAGQETPPAPSPQPQGGGTVPQNTTEPIPAGQIVVDARGGSDIFYDTGLKVSGWAPRPAGTDIGRSTGRMRTVVVDGTAYAMQEFQRGSGYSAPSGGTYYLPRTRAAGKSAPQQDGETTWYNPSTWF